MPLDIPGLVRQTLAGDERAPDGLLHASSHLTAPLRHVQLELAGAPQRPRSTADYTTLMTGTLWHSYMEDALRGLHRPIMTEVALSHYMPEGWGGTADWVIWSDEHRAFVLGDLKTIKGAGLPWILDRGAKDDHLWQLSAYWHALANMGLPLVEGFAITYLPKDGVPGRDLEPTVMECDVIDEYTMLARMEMRREAVLDYLEGGDAELAPIEARELKRIWNAKKKEFDVVLKPHWSAAYCRFIDCGCADQGQEKIGHYALDTSAIDTDRVEWVPRNVKYYDEPDAVRPSITDWHR